MKDKILVLSGRYPRTEYKSYENHMAYCTKNQYFYIHCCNPTIAKNLYFNKIYYILECFKLDFDYIFWLDDDAYFIDFNIKLESFLPKSPHSISICKGPPNQKVKTLISSGQMLIKCEKKAHDFFQEILDTKLGLVKKNWKNDYHYFTGGDQDIILYNSIENASFKDILDLRPYYEFNSRVEHLLNGDNPFLIHTTGTKKNKRNKLQLACKYLKTNENLIKVKSNLNIHYKKNFKSKLYKLIYILFYHLKKTFSFEKN
jgi:hypothetical protein